MNPKFLAVILGLLLLPSLATAQTTTLNSTRVVSTDGDFGGRLTVGRTTLGPDALDVEGPSVLNGTLQVNATMIRLGDYRTPYLGNLSNATLTGFRAWTLQDASGTLPLLEVAQTWTQTQTFGVNAVLDGSTITTGTIAAARLPANVAYKDIDNAWSALQTFAQGLTVSTTKSALLSPTTTAGLPAVARGALVYDGTTEQYKVGQGASPSYQVVALLGVANTWTQTQTFSVFKGQWTDSTGARNIELINAGSSPTLRGTGGDPIALDGMNVRFRVGGTESVRVNATGLQFGVAQDASLDRAAAGVLRTPGAVEIGGGTVATAGTLRLANNQPLSWRNAANTANVDLYIDSADRLRLNNVLTDTTATAGGVALPLTASGFLEMNIGGTIRKVPYYND